MLAAPVRRGHPGGDWAMSLDDRMGTPPVTTGNPAAATDELGAMDEQYAAFQASIVDDDTPPDEGAEPEPGLGPAEAEQGEELGADPQFETVEQFVTGWVMPFYVRDTANAVWCRQWWAHPEAGLRLEALWEAYEGARASKDGGAFAAWWRLEADHHLPLLYSPGEGPFRECDARAGTHTPQTPQPVDPAPRGTYVADGPAHGGPTTPTTTDTSSAHTDGRETGSHGTTRARGDARGTGPSTAGSVAGVGQPAGTQSPFRSGQSRPNAGGRRR